jgi:hypothetical protein
MRRVAPLVILACVLAGCGKTNPELIPTSNADALNKTADAIQAACDKQDRTEARKQARLALTEISGLPRSVSSDLRTNLAAWVKQVQDRISEDCKAAETPTPTSTPTETVTQGPTETPTATATASATASASPTQAPTEAPTEAPTQAPTESAAPTTTPAGP